MKTSAKSFDAPRSAPSTPAEIYAHLDTHVIGQERAKKAIAVAAYNHVLRISAPRGKRRLRKSNVLLVGPTGSGKTHLGRTLAEALGVPFTIVDATEYTEAGYYGKDVEVMIAELLFSANHSIEDTQRGIVFIDEVDKLARRAQGARNGAGPRDIGGEGVQQSLLKLLEGRELFVPLNVTQHWNKHDFVKIDTSDILFVCAGTFSDLFEARGDGPAKSLGFGSSDQTTKRRRVGPKDLLEFGMIAEFLGRLPVVVDLDPLDVDDLERILGGTPDAVAREFVELLQIDGVDLVYGDGALRAIAEHAKARGHGARGLRGVLEEVMRDVLFEAPSRRGEHLTVTRAFVEERLAALGDEATTK